MLATSLAQAHASGPVHVVMDATGLKVYGAGKVLASELTTSEDGDASQVGPLLGRSPGPIASVMADGAYDGEPVHWTVAESQPYQHIQMIGDKGRLGWQKAIGYGQRSHAQTSMFRYKVIIGSSLRSRILPARKPRPRSPARC